MNDKQKQIEAIANSVSQIICKECAHSCYNVTNCKGVMNASKILYDDDIRKIDECSVVISKEEYEVLKIKEKEKHWLQTCMSVWENAKIDARKETAKEIIYKLKDIIVKYRGVGCGVHPLMFDLYEFAKQYGVEENV